MACYMAVSTYDVDASRVHHPAMAGIDYACLERLRLKYLLVAWRAWIRDINLLAFPRGTRLGICLGIILTLGMTGRKISITDVLMIKYNVYTVIKCTDAVNNKRVSWHRLPYCRTSSLYLYDRQLSPASARDRHQDLTDFCISTKYNRFHWSNLSSSCVWTAMSLCSSWVLTAK